MPFHSWGDEEFDWKGLYSAIEEASEIMAKYGRIGVHSKEKFGTARWSLDYCDGTLHSFTHPGYYRSQYPQWLWNFDLDYQPLKWIAPAIRFWQRCVTEYAFTKICNKYPHLLLELVVDAPVEVLPPHLALVRAKLWYRTCTSCGKSNTTDLLYCEHCGSRT